MVFGTNHMDYSSAIFNLLIIFLRTKTQALWYILLNYDNNELINFPVHNIHQNVWWVLNTTKLPKINGIYLHTFLGGLNFCVLWGIHIEQHAIIWTDLNGNIIFLKYIFTSLFLVTHLVREDGSTTAVFGLYPPCFILWNPVYIKIHA